MKKQILRFLSDETGATAIEYALIASLIAIAIIAGARSSGTNINSKFNAVAVSISAAR